MTAHFKVTDSLFPEKVIIDRKPRAEQEKDRPLSTWRTVSGDFDLISRTWIAKGQSLLYLNMCVDVKCYEQL